MRKGKFFFTLLSRSPCLLSFPTNHKKKPKNKNKLFFFPHNGVRSWLAYPKSLCFQVFSLFLIVVITQGARQRAYVAEKARKKNFPYCFLFTAIVQGAQQREYVVRGGNIPRLKQKNNFFHTMGQILVSLPRKSMFSSFLTISDLL